MSTITLTLPTGEKIRTTRSKRYFVVSPTASGKARVDMRTNDIVAADREQRLHAHPLSLIYDLQAHDWLGQIQVSNRVAFIKHQAGQTSRRRAV